MTTPSAAGKLGRRIWSGRRTLRTRVTALASVAITVAVVLGVLFMYLLQMQSVRATIDSQLRTYATQIEQSASDGTWPQPLATSTLDSNAEAQVIAADGHVLAATRTLTGLPAVYSLPAGSSTPVRQKAADGVIPTDVRVIALRATVHGQPVTIITGTSTDLLRQVNAEFIRHLLLGLPVILVGAAGIVWLVVGRALRPVEKIRHAVTDITSADLSQRVPEPGTADEIGNLAHTMNDMLDRLDAAASKQRRFVADASHELRSPLAAIRTTLEVGLAHPDRAPWPIIAERAAQQSARLEDLIQQLLLLAKADERLLAAGQRNLLRQRRQHHHRTRRRPSRHLQRPRRPHHPRQRQRRHPPFHHLTPQAPVSCDIHRPRRLSPDPAPHANPAPPTGNDTGHVRGGVPTCRPASPSRQRGRRSPSRQDRGSARRTSGPHPAILTRQVRADIGEYRRTLARSTGPLGTSTAVADTYIARCRHPRGD